jgi:hypothetical protein
LAKPDNSTWNSIFVGTATALLGAAITYYVPPVWAFLKWAFESLLHVLRLELPLPIWSLLILAILIAPTFFRLLALLRKNPEPSWRDYTHDTFREMLWRWRFSSPNGGFLDLRCYCPADDTLLVYTECGSHGTDKIGFECETCGRRFGPFDGNREYFIASIERQIDRKLRTEEWKQLVESDAEETTQGSMSVTVTTPQRGLFTESSCGKK